jgi:hypothetical protein
MGSAFRVYGMRGAGRVKSLAARNRAMLVAGLHAALKEG